MKKLFLRHSHTGLTLIEMLSVLFIFGIAMALIALITADGFKAVSMASADHSLEVSLDKAYFKLKRDLEVVNKNRIACKRISLAGGGDAIWFQTPIDPLDSNPKTNFKRQADGTPEWRWQILYYLARPTNYSLVSGGITAAIDPDPEGDFFAPHKFLIRKVIKPGSSDELLTSSQIDTYITAPSDYSLSGFNSESAVIDYQLVADKLLSMQAKISESSLQVDLSAIRLPLNDRRIQLGQVSLKNNPERTARAMGFKFRSEE